MFDTLHIVYIFLENFYNKYLNLIKLIVLKLYLYIVRSFVTFFFTCDCVSEK